MKERWRERKGRKVKSRKLEGEGNGEGGVGGREGRKWEEKEVGGR